MCNSTNTRNQTGHQALLQKQRHMEIFKDALNIGADHKFGESFDVELQDRKRKAKLEEKAQKKLEIENERKLK